MKKRIARAQSQFHGSAAANLDHVDRIKNIGTGSGFQDKPGNKIELTGKAEKAMGHYAITGTFVSCPTEFFLIISFFYRRIWGSRSCC
jgi:hypothetical protein